MAKSNYLRDYNRIRRLLTSQKPEDKTRRTTANYSARRKAEEVRRILPERLVDVHIAEEQKAFILEFGLPNSFFASIASDILDQGLPRLTEIQKVTLPPEENPYSIAPNFENYKETLRLSPLPEWFDRFRVIGYGYLDVTLCIDESLEGAILCMQPILDPECLQVAFVNTDIIALSECRVAFSQRFRMLPDAPTENDMAQHFLEIERIFNEIDPLALANKRCYWYQHIQRIRETWGI